MSRFQAALIALLLLVVLPTPSAAQGVAAPGLAAPSPGVRPPLAAGQPSWHQDFEGPTTSWTDAGGDAQYTLVAHQRVRGWAHRGQGSEWIEVSAQGGNSVLIAHDIGRPRVIDDLRASIWIYADRPGIQFSAEVTLPRSVDPRSGKPLTTSVFAAAYSTAGRWQQIEIADFPRMVDRGVRILRSQSSLNIDGREAFVSRVLLNIYGGPGVTNVWTDDLEVFGLVPSDRLNDPETRRQGDAVIPVSPPSPRLRVSAARCRPAAARGQAGGVGLDGQRPSDLPPLHRISR